MNVSPRQQQGQGIDPHTRHVLRHQPSVQRPRKGPNDEEEGEGHHVGADGRDDQADGDEQEPSRHVIPPHLSSLLPAWKEKRSRSVGRRTCVKGRRGAGKEAIVLRPLAKQLAGVVVLVDVWRSLCLRDVPVLCAGALRMLLRVLRCFSCSGFRFEGAVAFTEAKKEGWVGRGARSHSSKAPKSEAARATTRIAAPGDLFCDAPVLPIIVCVM